MEAARKTTPEDQHTLTTSQLGDIKLYTTLLNSRYYPKGHGGLLTMYWFMFRHQVRSITRQRYHHYLIMMMMMMIMMMMMTMMIMMMMVLNELVLLVVLH